MIAEGLNGNAEQRQALISQASQIVAHARNVLDVERARQSPF
jgi:hypothetical protein